ncbi:SpoIVB peptidase [Proteinivorax hydrogeniformans]|uniref:SpoIVB peptidase n=1 Tax=Proteinivorax hydrogeniformans TaxID=1826727 RepID=A0AAU8HRM1_9FIRM
MCNLKNNKILGFLLVVLIAVAAFSSPMRTYYSVPESVRMFTGQEHYLDFGLPMGVSVKGEANDFYINGAPISNDSLPLDTSETLAMLPGETGSYELTFNLLGLIPLRKVNVEVVPPMEVIPGGESIGVRVSDEGVIVVGTDKVYSDGGSTKPAKNAGIQPGDVILKVNNKKVTDISEAASAIELGASKGEKILFTVRREDKIFDAKVSPKMCSETNSYRIGLFIKDTTAGVGTLTFVDPNSKTYGALGHIIMDRNNAPLSLEYGSVVEANITGVIPGRQGNPGEKRGVFKGSDTFHGDITKNSHFGIFGKLDQLGNVQNKEPLKIGLKHQAQTGPAEILTVVEGDKVESFDIEIEKILSQNSPQTKGMVIKITDERLLEKTGGIIQGMSGSPIIQNDKLVGAVTHVFVNEPAKGYGCFIEWMILESDMLN